MGLRTAIRIIAWVLFLGAALFAHDIPLWRYVVIFTFAYVAGQLFAKADQMKKYPTQPPF
jgi:hypothetical protein